MQQVSDNCANCATDAKCRRRDFSEQAWTVLVIWSEVKAAAVDQPICEDCYNELREVLIDRSEEIEQAVAEPTNPATPSPAKRSATQRPKVRKAG